jgi:hypothetical protein
MLWSPAGVTPQNGQAGHFLVLICEPICVLGISAPVGQAYAFAAGDTSVAHRVRVKRLAVRNRASRNQSSLAALPGKHAQQFALNAGVQILMAGAICQQVAQALASSAQSGRAVMLTRRPV